MASRKTNLEKDRRQETGATDESARSCNEWGECNAPVEEQVLYGKSDAQGFDYHGNRIGSIRPEANNVVDDA